MNEYLTFLKNDKVLLVTLCAVIFTAILFGIIIGRVIAGSLFAKELKESRADAVKRSRAVLGGQMAEQVAPFLPDFPCNPADVRFIGKPLDFIAFPGMAEGKPVEEILLIEVKTGGSQLSQREKEIRKACQEGKVRYIEYRSLD